MAGTWTRTQRTQVDFDVNSRIYTVTYTYVVEGITSEVASGQHSGPTTFDDEIDVVHNGQDLDGAAYMQHVTCFYASKSVRLVTPDDNAMCEVDVIYRGRVQGFLKVASRGSLRPQVRYEDMKLTTIDGEDVHRGIGVDERGIAIKSPMLQVGLVMVIPTRYLRPTLAAIASVACLANEYGWLPPWYRSPIYAAKGYFLCNGVTTINSDDTTQTTEITIEFEHDYSRQYGQHLYQFRKGTSTQEGDKTIRVYEDALVEVQIYGVGGEAVNPGEDIEQEFADKINDAFIFPDTTPQRLLVR